jgi:hypothetical protein
MNDDDDDADADIYIYTPHHPRGYHHIRFLCAISER